MTIDMNELIWAIINFLVLLAILYKFLYHPILDMIDQRKQEVASNLYNAEASRKEAEELFERHKRELEEARDKAQEIIGQAQKAAEDAKSGILAEAREEAAKISEKAKQEIVNEKDRALHELRQEIATLAVMAAGKVLEKSISKEDHEKMVNDFISEVGDVQ